MKTLKILGIILLYIIIQIPLVSYPLHLFHYFINNEYSSNNELKLTIVLIVSLLAIVSLTKTALYILKHIANENKEDLK